jgi:ATP-dependent DNA helicase RecG
MYTDKIIVSSPSGLMPEMNLEAFFNGRYSYLRNPILANVFHRLDIVEIFATGIKRIKESYKDFDLKPSFDVNESYISITLPIKKEIELTEKRFWITLMKIMDIPELSLRQQLVLRKTLS